MGWSVFVGAHAFYEQRCGENREEKNIKWSCSAPWCHPKSVFSALTFTCPSQHGKWEHLHAHRGLKFLPARSQAPWWQTDRWHLEDKGTRWRRKRLACTDQVAALPPASSCPSSRTMLLCTQEHKSFLAATAWTLMLSPNMRHLQCPTHPTRSWNSYWLNSTASWYLSPRYPPSGWPCYKTLAVPLFSEPHALHYQQVDI